MLYLFKKKFSKKMPKIGVLYLEGTISAEKSKNFLEESSSAHLLMNHFNSIVSHHEYDGILLRINSPGGTAGASEELARSIIQVREAGIPVVASVIDMACSGAYMIAACCDRIFANKMSIVGSIGVIMQIPNYTEFSKKVGFTLNTIKAGDMKDIGNPSRSMTPEEKAFLEHITQQSHKEFISLIKEHRNIDDEMTDGRILDAKTALEHGLIDEYGTYYDALDYLICKQLKLKRKDVFVEEDPTSTSLLKRIIGTAVDNVTTKVANGITNYIVSRLNTNTNISFK